MISDPRGVFTAIVVACDRLGVERIMKAAVASAEYDLPTSLKRRLVDSDYLDSTEADCVVDRLAALRPRRGIRLGYDDDRYEELIANCKL